MHGHPVSVPCHGLSPVLPRGKDQSTGHHDAHESSTGNTGDEAAFKPSGIISIIRRGDADADAIVRVGFIRLDSEPIRTMHPREGPGPW